MLSSPFGDQNAKLKRLAFLRLHLLNATFSTLITLHGLLGTPGNLELRKRRGVARLAFNDVSLAGLVGDVDAGHDRDTVKNGVVYAGHLW